MAVKVGGAGVGIGVAAVVGGTEVGMGMAVEIGDRRATTLGAAVGSRVGVGRGKGVALAPHAAVRIRLATKITGSGQSFSPFRSALIVLQPLQDK